MPDSLFKKLWLTITVAILITILYSFILSYLFYEKLYVDRVELTLFNQGKMLAQDYHGGPLTAELKRNIRWYNEKSETELSLVTSPIELGASYPFKANMKTLISPKEREQLLEGNIVSKSGYEERFNRKIIAVIIPLLDNGSLKGAIYLHVPLAKISELTTDFTYLWLFGGFAFIVIAIFLGYYMTGRLTGPLAKMKQAAKKLSQGNYSTRVEIQSNDEIGQLAAAFNQMSEAIQQEDERKRDFLADVSHELRTPISYIQGYSEGLVSGFIKTPKEQEKYLKLINRESGRMVKLVSDLLDLSKLDAGQYTLEKHPFPLAQLIEDFTQKYTQTLKTKQIILSINLDPEVIIEADEGKIEQILQNIMDNAVCYTGAGGMISLSLEEDNFGAMIKVADTGIGIPAEELEKITERFYRVNKARSRTDGGTGLGLAITEKLVRLHKGKIKVASIVGEGTVVTIRLPAL